jgi:hypothetical protein
MSHIVKILTSLDEARYLHRIPRVANPNNLDFTWGPDGMKKRRKKPMDKLINNNGQWIRS